MASKYLEVEGGVATYNSYVAELNQPGDTSDPTVTEITNELSDEVVWSRSAQGVYDGVLADAFPDGQTRLETDMPAFRATPDESSEFKADLLRVDDDTVRLRVYDAGGNLVDGFTGLQVTIQVYPS